MIGVFFFCVVLAYIAIGYVLVTRSVRDEGGAPSSFEFIRAVIGWVFLVHVEIDLEAQNPEDRKASFWAFGALGCLIGIGITWIACFIAALTPGGANIAVVLLSVMILFAVGCRICIGRSNQHDRKLKFMRKK